MSLFLYYTIFSFLTGLCIGSFLNVVVLRGFSGESIVLPPSKCPNCKNVLKWYDNIPVLSFILLQGKCRFCKCDISIQYPIVELLCGFLFCLSFIKFGFSIKTLFAFVFFSLFIVIAVSDLKEKVIFTSHTYILAAFGLIFAFINKNFLPSVFWMLLGFAFFEIISFISKKITGKRAFGEGDSFVSGALGAVFANKLWLIIILSFILQAVAILPEFIKNIINTKQYKLIVSLIIFSFLTISNYFLLKFESAFQLQIANILMLSTTGLISCFLLKLLRLLLF